MQHSIIFHAVFVNYKQMFEIVSKNFFRSTFTLKRLSTSFKKGEKKHTVKKLRDKHLQILLM